MTTEIAVRHNGVPAQGAAALEKIVMTGDLKDLAAADRLIYYRDVCQSVGLNPLTRPFDYISLNGKVVLYARKDATDQLRHVREISIPRLDRGIEGDLYIVTAYANTPDGRQDSDVGAVSIKGLAGEALANAIMK